MAMDRTRRTPVVLVCTECKARNYKTTKKASAPLAGASDAGGGVALFELKKFCKQCQKHTAHRETK
jgi:large subunit ribosomal protein L33